MKVSDILSVVNGSVQIAEHTNKKDVVKVIWQEVCKNGIFKRYPNDRIMDSMVWEVLVNGNSIMIIIY